jgi:glycerophosphoryl diester phosphodiesterase
MKLNHPIFNGPLAHRGLHNDDFDENSMAAFANAVKNGYGIELDVHLLKDGNLVVFHDENLKRVVGVDVNLSSLTYDEVKQYLLPKTKTTLPLLKDVLDLVNGQVPLLIELKLMNKFDEAFPKAVLEELKDYKYKESIALQSFNPYAMKWLRQNQTYPYLLGQLGSNILPGQSKFVHFAFRHLFVAKIAKPDFINWEVSFINKRNIQRYRKKHGLLTWTINDDKKLETAEKYADNIVFEHLKLKKGRN